MRIVSLLPSATEIICALAARSLLVGRSHECDYPVSVRGVPSLTRTRFALGSSRSIDMLARATLAEATSIYAVDALALEAARPDVIVSAQFARFERRDARVVNLGPLTLADVWCDVKRTADAIGRHEAGIKLARQLEARVADVSAIARASHHRPSVLVVDWIDPLMVAGLWMPELVTLAGGVPLAATAGAHGRVLDARALGELDPGIVLVAACGFTAARTIEEADVLFSKLPRHWRAVRKNRVYVADGNAFFNRPGPRLVESLEILASVIHPRAFGKTMAHQLIDRTPTSGADARAGAARSLRFS